MPEWGDTDERERVFDDPEEQTTGDYSSHCAVAACYGDSTDDAGCDDLELEALGYIETQRGRGTFVCERPPHQDRAQQLAPVRETARKLLTQAYLAGMPLPEVMDLLRQADREITTGPPKQKEHV